MPPGRGNGRAGHHHTGIDGCGALGGVLPALPCDLQNAHLSHAGSFYGPFILHVAANEKLRSLASDRIARYEADLTPFPQNI